MAETDPDGAVREEATTLPAWVELIRHRFTDLRIAPRDRDAVVGDVWSRRIGPLQASAVRSSAQRFDKTRTSAARETDGLLAIGLVDRGTGCLEQDGRSCSVSAGDFALYDTTRPFTWSFSDDWTLRVYTWPHSSLPYAEAMVQGLTALLVPGEPGVLGGPRLGLRPARGTARLDHRRDRGLRTGPFVTPDGSGALTAGRQPAAMTGRGVA